MHIILQLIALQLRLHALQIFVQIDISLWIGHHPDRAMILNQRQGNKAMLPTFDARKISLVRYFAQLALIVISPGVVAADKTVGSGLSYPEGITLDASGALILGTDDGDLHRLPLFNSKEFGPAVSFAHVDGHSIGLATDIKNNVALCR